MPFRPVESLVEIDEGVPRERNWHKPSLYLDTLTCILYVRAEGEWYHVRTQDKDKPPNKPTKPNKP